MSEQDVPEPTRARIRELLARDRVVLFMKGKRHAPQCGFSASVVEMLDSWLDEYATVDVIADPELREAIKQFSDWPTIPQLYVGGEFIGGADILRELSEQGELATALGVAEQAVTPPNIRVSEAAAAAIKAAFASPDVEEGDVLRLAVDSRYRNDLSIGPRRPSDVIVESAGVVIGLDRASARRAEGISIDYVETAEGVGFKLENPAAPQPVRAIGAKELADRMAQARAAGKALHLYDVRTEEEVERAHIEGAVLLDPEVADEIAALPRDTPLYFHCHHGIRSQRAAEHFVELGFREVYNLTGGIAAWSEQVDPSVPQY
jgi:monothiol glutaredoxin